MHIDSWDLIVSVNSSSYGDYKGKKANGCRITIVIQHHFIATTTMTSQFLSVILFIDDTINL